MVIAARRVIAKLGIPPEVSGFIIRASLLTAAWKMAYVYWMRPSAIPDALLVRTLGQSTAWWLNQVFEDGYVAHFNLANTGGSDRIMEPASTLFGEGDIPLLLIHSSCDGLDLMALSAGFVVCFPGILRRKIFFITICLLSVFLINVLRCGLLCVVWSQMPQHFDFVHKFLFNLIAYAGVFGLWMAYVGRGSRRDSPSADSIV